MDSRNAQPAVAALTECAIAAFLPVTPSSTKMNSDWKATTSPRAPRHHRPQSRRRYIELRMPLSALALTFKPPSGSTGTRSSYGDAS